MLVYDLVVAEADCVCGAVLLCAFALFVYGLMYGIVELSESFMYPWCYPVRDRRCERESISSIKVVMTW